MYKPHSKQDYLTQRKAVKKATHAREYGNARDAAKMAREFRITMSSKERV